MKKVILYLGGLCLAFASSTQAGSAFFDFNSDPTAGGLATLYGSAAWVPDDGAGYATNANDGYLQITPAQNSEVGAIVFSDFDNGAIVGGLHFEADVRIGNGSNPPADGFCIAYARSTDPALASPDNSALYAQDPGGGNGIGPEEGTTTGIAVGFNTYPNDAQDLVGIDLRIDGKLTSFPMPTIDGLVTDPTSIQTGTNDGTGNPDVLGWAHLIVDLQTNGTLNLYYKGAHLLTNYATGYIPGPGQLLVAGRTGGLNENQDVDNIAITTYTVQASLGPITAFPDGVQFVLLDSGPSVVNPSTISFSFNGGSALTPTSVTKSGTQTTVTYHSFPIVLPSGSSNQLSVTFKDTQGANLGGTRAFTTPTYTVFPASDAATGVNTSLPGYRLLPWQSPNEAGVGEPNAVYWMQEQLMGLQGANNADLSSATDNGYIDFTGLINFNVWGAFGGGADIGDFQSPDYPDAAVPGIPGPNGLTGSIALEALTFLQFDHPGVYTMGVNSDDGFAVTEGVNPRDRFANVLGEYNGGRGSSDTTFDIVVPTAGIYPIRLAYENGAGEGTGNGANLEWFMVDSNGYKILLNDPSPTNDTGVEAFYSGPALPAFVSQVIPYPGATGVRPDYALVQLTDGSTTVNQGSISLLLNGAAVTPTVSKSGGVTSVALNPGIAQLMPPGSNTLTLVWNDNANHSTTNTWNFTVETYKILDPSLSSPIATVDTKQPGMVLAVSQVDPSVVGDSGDSTPNQLDSANGALAGLYFPWYGSNVVDTVGGGATGIPAVTNNVWYWTNVVDFNVITSPGDFTYDYQMPGIPGQTGQENYFVAGFQSYVVFPSAGFYQMGVNSDDGFRVTEGIGVTRQVLHVTGPAINTFVEAVVTTSNNAAYGATLPAVPISGPVVFVPVPCPSLPGAVNLTGKIGVTDYSSCSSGFGVHDLAYNLQTNGALAAIVINNPAYGLPFVDGDSGAPVTIPVLVVNGDFGQRDFWVTNTGLSATIGADAHLNLGEADEGKGMSHVDFGFIVPSAGAYPLRLLYFQGSGGSGLEWSTVLPGLTADGNRMLVNDTTTPGSLLTYRAVTTTPQFNAATLSGGALNLSWTQAAILQEATSLSPTNWTDVVSQPTGAAYSVPAAQTADFYRLRLPMPPTP